MIHTSIPHRLRHNKVAWGSKQAKSQTTDKKNETEETIPKATHFRYLPSYLRSTLGCQPLISSSFGGGTLPSPTSGVELRSSAVCCCCSPLSLSPRPTSIVHATHNTTTASNKIEMDTAGTGQTIPLLPGWRSTRHSKPC